MNSRAGGVVFGLPRRCNESVSATGTLADPTEHRGRRRPRGGPARRGANDSPAARAPATSGTARPGAPASIPPCESQCRDRNRLRLRDPAASWWPPPGRCRAPRRQTRYDLTIAATTDVHGRLRGWDYYANAADSARSLASAATIVDSLRRRASRPGGAARCRRPAAGQSAALRRGPGDAAAGAPGHRRHERHASTTRRCWATTSSTTACRCCGAPSARPASRSSRPTSATRNGAAVRRPVHDRHARRCHGADGAHRHRRCHDAGLDGVGRRQPARRRGLTVTDIMPAVRRAVAEVRRRKADVVVVLLHSGLNGRRPTTPSPPSCLPRTSRRGSHARSRASTS